MANATLPLRLPHPIPQIGTLLWIGLRPERRAGLRVVSTVEVDPQRGLHGERTDGGQDKQRQVTLFQYEHLEMVRQILGHPPFSPELPLDPGLLRRNLVVRGINLAALKRQYFRIGEVLLWGTGDCPPCSRMEENLGPGGWAALRGHGGLTARIERGGRIALGDTLRWHGECDPHLDARGFESS